MPLEGNLLTSSGVLALSLIRFSERVTPAARYLINLLARSLCCGAKFNCKRKSLEMPAISHAIFAIILALLLSSTLPKKWIKKKIALVLEGLNVNILKHARLA